MTVAPVPWFLAENGFWFALRESSWPGVVVCVVLAVLSCFSWAVMFSKLRVVSRTARRDDRFLEGYREHRDPLGSYEGEEVVAGSPACGIYHAGARELTFHLLGSTETDETFRARLESSGKLRPSQLEAVSNAMDRAVSGAAGKLEAQMSVLATAVSGAPFLGLLGTVWGVMDTFSGVAASEGVASLKTMAPGVSAALVTTVVALLVAIPAMFGYNYLVNRIRGMIAELDNFAAELRLDFERWYVDHHPAERAPAAAGGSRVAGAAAVPLRRRRLEPRDLDTAPAAAGAVADAPDTPAPHRIVKRAGTPVVHGEFDLEP